MKFKWNSIITKSLLLVVGAIVLCGLGLIFLVSSEVLGNYEKQIIENDLLNLDNVESYFDEDLKRIETDIHVLGYILEQEYGNKLKNPEAYDAFVFDYFSDYLKLNYAASYSLYTYFEPTSQEDVLDVWLTNQEGSIIRHDMIPYERYVKKDNMTWFYDVKEEGFAYWVAPYRNRYNEYITSYVKPLYYNNNFIGIIGMYFDVSQLRDFLAPLNINSDKYYWVINQHDEIIYHPMLNEGSPNPLSDYKLGGDYIITEIDDIKYRHYSSIIDSNWTFVCSVKEETVLQDKTIILKKISLIFIMFVGLLSLLITLIMKRYTNVLEKMIYALKKTQRGDLSSVVPVESHDEIGTLALVLNESLESISKEQIKLERLCYYNSLTTLPNIEKLKHDLNLYGNRDMVLYLLDLDNFRTINDLLGKAKSDAFILEISEKLIEAQDRNLYVYHTSGDEFAFLEFEPKMDQVSSNAEFIINLFKQLAFSTIHNIGISTSIGIAKYPDDVTLSGGLIDCAHIALTHAKKEGRNNYKMFSRFLPTNESNSAVIIHELKKAVENDEFVVFYQPIIDKNETLISLEALVRWQHPTEGLLLPEVFLHLIEQADLISDFSQIVLKHICHDYKSLLNQHYYVKKIYLNLSQRQLLNPLFVSNTLALLRQENFPIDLLGIEITEHILQYDFKATLKKLNALKVLGVDIVLDDFGSGDASLNSLKTLPLSKVKIDCELIKQISEDKQTSRLIKGIIQMMHQLNIVVVAECVEDQKTFEILQAMACDEFQGNHLYPALSTDKLVQLKGSTQK